MNRSEEVTVSSTLPPFPARRVTGIPADQSLFSRHVRPLTRSLLFKRMQAPQSYASALSGSAMKTEAILKPSPPLWT